MRNRGGNRQLDLGTGIELTPDGQRSPRQFGAFFYARQAVMALAAPNVQNLQVDALAIISHPHPELTLVVVDFHFDAAAACWNALRKASQAMR